MSAPNRSALAPVGPATAAEDAIAACAAPFSTPGNANRLPSTPPRRNNSRRVIVDLVIVNSQFVIVVRDSRIAVRGSRFVVTSYQLPVTSEVRRSGDWKPETS